MQDVTPEVDDGCIVMRGTIGGQQAVVIVESGRAAFLEESKQEGKPKESTKRPIIAIVDVKSQAYGRREETAGIHLAAAAAADAYASARFAGHPVIALISGHDLRRIPHPWLPGQSSSRF
jgi:malonate decarboxylase gamma subunit